MTFVDAPARMLDQPRVGSMWRHWKNKKIYTVKGFALFAAPDSPNDGRRLLVIYEDVEGGSYARMQFEWHDLMLAGGVQRFTEVVRCPVDPVIAQDVYEIEDRIRKQVRQAILDDVVERAKASK